MPKGLLFVILEPPPPMENEFNDWYDLEHFPQRLTIPGIENGSRWVCVDGWPRYLAMYDLESTAVTETAAYLAVSAADSTPWTKRVAARCLGRQRVIVPQTLPGDALLPDMTHLSRLLLANYPGGDAADAAALMERKLPQLAQARIFTAPDRLWLVAAFSQPVSAQNLMDAYGKAAHTGASMFNLYVPYVRSEA